MMRHLIFIIMTTFGQIALAQDVVMMDGNNPKDDAVYLKTVNGNSTLVDGHGHTINAHPVFSTDISERISRGWAKRVDRGGERSTSRGADAGPVFNLTYLDVVNSTGKGFSDPQKGAQRRASLEAAFQYFSESIDNDGEVDIEIRESFEGSPTSNPFAFAASYYFGSVGFNRSFTQQHIITGSDPYPDFPDGYIQFNFHSGMNYHYSKHDMPGENQFDFYTIALHEIMHLVGFTSYLDGQGNSAASPGVFTEFDGLLRDINKEPLITVTGSGQSAQVVGPVATQLTNSQVWSELETGGHAPVYSPEYFTGSSCDHFDNSRGTGNYVMHPSLSRGNAFKLLDAEEVTALTGLGYQMDMSVATGLRDDGPLEEIGNLYPNPARKGNGIEINVGQQSGEEVLVIVFDMLGRESYSKIVVQNQKGPIMAIDPYNNLSAGMYIVIGSTDDELFNQKLVIR
ncbi:MAG: hypothetical protein ACI85F_001857 [Bacteroidia bacterium]|jgi:hypothetical protein